MTARPRFSLRKFIPFYRPNMTADRKPDEFVPVTFLCHEPPPGPATGARRLLGKFLLCFVSALLLGFILLGVMTH